MPFSRVHTAMFLLVAITLQWPWNCFAGKEERAIRKIGKRLEKIHAISYQLSLHPNEKTMLINSANKIYRELTIIQKHYPSVSDTAPIKEPLQKFLSRWNNAELIAGSLSDGEQKFMADVTAFYLRGLVERKKEGKTIFPMFKP